MNKIKTVVITGIVLLVIGVVGSLLTYQFMDYSAATKTEAVPSEQIVNVEINADNENVTIIPMNNTSEITVELIESGLRKVITELNLQVDGDTLTIETVKPKMFFYMNLFGDTRDLNVYVPEKVYHSLDVSLDNGKLEITDVKIGEIAANADNGNIHIENLRTENITISLNNGNVHLSHVDGTITGNIDNGDFTVKTKSLDRTIDWKVDNGNIKIETETEPTNTVLDLQTKNGQISVFENSDWNTIIGAGEHLLKLRVNNGDIKIHNP